VLNFDLGILNVTLGALGLPAVDWLGDPRLALGAVIAVDVWHWTPFVFLLLLAGLESLPAEQYEAAALDGATRWQQFRYLTVPLMWPTIMITLVFRIVFSFKVFDEIYLLTRGGPGTSTEVVSYTIYRTYFAEDRAGVGSVMSLFTVAMIAISAIIVINLRRRKAVA
jgi:multiple sugar transport system permease protein